MHDIDFQKNFINLYTTFKCKSLLKYKNVFNMQVVCNKTVLGEKNTIKVRKQQLNTTELHIVSSLI